MDVNFQQGYEYFRKHADTFVGAVDGADLDLKGFLILMKFNQKSIN